MDGQAGERAHHKSWSLVLAGYIGALARVNDLARPGVIISVVVCLAALREARDFAGVLPTLEVGAIAFPLALSPFHRALIELFIVCGLILAVCAWWLPNGQRAALFIPLALAGLAVPLVVDDPLLAACGLAIAAAAVSSVLAQSDQDGGAAPMIGAAALGTLCLVIAVAVTRSAANPELQAPLSLARVAALAGAALSLGIAPLWAASVAGGGQPVGAALTMAAYTPAALIVNLRIFALPGLDLMTANQDQVIVHAGLAVVLVGALLALLQSDTRRLAAFLLLADLGCITIGLARGLQTGAVDALAPVAPQLFGRGLAALVIFPTLALSDQRRLARFVLAACSGWMILGGPLSASFPERWAMLQPLLAGGDPWAKLMIAAIALSLLAYFILLVRVATLRTSTPARPGQVFILAILAGLVVISIILWRDSSFITALVDLPKVP